jgi:hypothetical protein
MKKNIIQIKSHNKIFKNKSIKKNVNVLREINDINFLQKKESFFVVYLNKLKQNDLKLLKKELLSYQLQFKSIKPRKIKIFFKNFSESLKVISKNNIYFIKVKENFCIFDQFKNFCTKNNKSFFFILALFDNGFFYNVKKEKLLLDKIENATDLCKSLGYNLNNIVFNLSTLYINLCTLINLYLIKNNF